MCCVRSAHAGDLVHRQFFCFDENDAARVVDDFVADKVAEFLGDVAHLVAQRRAGDETDCDGFDDGTCLLYTSDAADE